MSAKTQQWFESFLESVNSGNKEAAIHDARGYTAACVAEARGPLVEALEEAILWARRASIRALEGSPAETKEVLPKLARWDAALADAKKTP